MEPFVIAKFESVFLARDPKGRRTEFSGRRWAAFIVTVSGKIRFSYEGGQLIAEAGHPVFLPKGFTYVNECLETAESYVFNFQTLHDDAPPMALSDVSDEEIAEYYETIQSKAFFSSLQNDLVIMETLYALARRLFRQTARSEDRNPMVTRALDFMHQYSGCAELTVGEVARHCCISEVYLRKLFVRELHTTPFRQLTEIRMRRARLLAEEKRPLKEIAECVGYADVFQFSRAYKRYFGHSPSKDQS